MTNKTTFNLDEKIAQIIILMDSLTNDEKEVLNERLKPTK